MAKRNFIPLVPSGTINADASVAQLEQDVLAMDAKVGELAEDIGDTEQEINQLKSHLNIQDVELYSLEYDGTSTKIDLTATQQWVWINAPISDGQKITEIRMMTKLTDSSNVAVTFCLYNIGAGNSFTRYSTQTVTGTVKDGVAIFSVNLKAVGESVLGFFSDTGFAYTVSVSSATDKVAYNSNKNLESGTLSLVGAYGIIGAFYYIGDAISELAGRVDALETVTEQEIHVGAGLEFEEIQPAIESVTGNYATIIVHPKSTPYSRFSLMRSLNGAYPWTGLETVKNISIIGIDKAKCVIQDNSGNYNTPPAEIATNGIIKNLTFIATHSASTEEETTGSYAVHVDNPPADENGMKLVFENCDFISYQTAAVGLGLYKNQSITFIGCNFKSFTDITWKPNESYDAERACRLGSVFAHCGTGDQAGNMFINFRQCFFYHDGGTRAIVTQETAPLTAYIEAIANTFYASDSSVDYVSNSIRLMPYNNGNSEASLNSN